MDKKPPLVVVGASYAGTQLAAAARELGYDSPIVLLGDESHPPYQRPPLSKGLLTGKTAAESLPLRGPDFFQEQGIDLRLGTRAASIDLAAKKVQLEDGTQLDYATLVLATGARCRPLMVSGSDLAGVYQLRTLDDALAVLQAVTSRPKVCAIGGGFIGLEVAAALAATGAEVTVVQSNRRLLARSVSEGMSEYIAQAHLKRGVKLELGHGVRSLRGLDGRVQAVELDDGRLIECDIVVLGIGVVPNDELARQAGISCDNGILVDHLGRTSAPSVLAVGDVANMRLSSVPGVPDSLQRVRLESIQAANDGARAAASLIAGQPQPYSAVPWFWSEQFDLKIQLAGLPATGDEMVARGELSSDRFTLFYLRDGVVAAAHSVNRPAEHMQARKLIAQRVSIPVADLTDPSTDLKALAASQTTKATP